MNADGPKAKLGSLDEAAVREAISGNLCRCGTYPHVVSAMLNTAGTPAEAADEQVRSPCGPRWSRRCAAVARPPRRCAPSWRESASLSVVGKPLLRVDGARR